MAHVEAALQSACHEIYRLDGLSLGFSDWRLKLRMSNTEPSLRLYVKRRGNAGALGSHIARVEALIKR